MTGFLYIHLPLKGFDALIPVEASRLIDLVPDEKRRSVLRELMQVDPAAVPASSAPDLKTLTESWRTSAWRELSVIPKDLQTSGWGAVRAAECNERLRCAAALKEALEAPSLPPSTLP